MAHLKWKNKNKISSWARKTPVKQSSNGINSDGSLMNLNNKLGEKPSIKLFPKYNSGNSMKKLLYQTNYKKPDTFQKIKKQYKNQRMLWEACRKGDTDLVKETIEKGADPLLGNVSDKNWIALHYAVANKKFLTSSYLISLPSAFQQCIKFDTLNRTPVNVSKSTIITNRLKKVIQNY